MTLVSQGEWVRRELPEDGIHYHMTIELPQTNHLEDPLEHMRMIVDSVYRTAMSAIPYCNFQGVSESRKDESEIQDIRNLMGDPSLDHIGYVPVVEQFRHEHPPLMPNIDVWYGKNGASMIVSVTEQEYKEVIEPILKKVRSNFSERARSSENRTRER